MSDTDFLKLSILMVIDMRGIHIVLIDVNRERVEVEELNIGYEIGAVLVFHMFLFWIFVSCSVRNSAYEITKRKHATYYGIAMIVERLCEAIIHDENLCFLFQA